ncbi:sin3 histone deacetylase corepressor complex component SDS3 [Tetranychus urticae]|uniref:Uncharacterized protein n=1 Tax=Tetranychus urticae TaxID=32264 RepID=T1KQT7_TETUR|nr:sin3 histone deacetylase corepressor complex component SDS3 [Tetranychus urticae]
MSDCGYTSETDDASETEYFEDLQRSKNGHDEETAERSKFLDSIYQEKLADLQDQLRQLDEGVHPVYVERLKKCEQEAQDRLLANESYLSYEREKIEREYTLDKQAARQEFEKRKKQLKESLIADLLEERKRIEAERANMKLCPDSPEPVAKTTRKLRRRQNDPTPAQRKRAVSNQLNYQLDEKEINEDLKALKLKSK